MNLVVVNVIIGLIILFSLIQCFYGYRIFKSIIKFMGFLVGAIVAGLIGMAISKEEMIAIFTGFIGGFVGAEVFLAFYFIGIFFTGAFLGSVLGTVLFAMEESSPEPAVLIILAVIAGVIALIYQKFMIIVSTGFSGAWVAVIGIAYFTTGAIEPENFARLLRSGGGHLYATLLCWLALGIMSVIVQYKTAPRAES